MRVQYQVLIPHIVGWYGRLNLVTHVCAVRIDQWAEHAYESIPPLWVELIEWHF